MNTQPSLQSLKPRASVTAIKVLVSGICFHIATIRSSQAQDLAPKDDKANLALSIAHTPGAQEALAKSMMPLRMAMGQMVSLISQVPLNKALELWDTQTLPVLQSRNDELLAIKAHVLTKHFSAAELAEMKAFFYSPTGEKLIRTQDEVFTDYMREASPIVSEAFNKANATPPANNRSGSP